MTPWLEEWLQSLRAVEAHFHHFPALEMLFFYFRYEGLGSIVLWMLALLLLLAYALRWRRSLVCWTALAVAIGGFMLARVNSHNVSAIKIDFSEQLQAAKARAEEEAADQAPVVESDMSEAARQAKRAEVEGGEIHAGPDDPPDFPTIEGATEGTPRDSATGDEPVVESPDDDGQAVGAEPRYAYRQEGQVQRTEGKQSEEKVPIDAGTAEETAALSVRTMKMHEVAQANRLDRLNLFFARCTLCLTAGLFVIDYFRRFNTTFGCYLPLPLSGRLVDSLFPKSHTVCVGRRRRKWKRYLKRVVRKGETFVLFSRKDPWSKRGKKGPGTFSAKPGTDRRLVAGRSGKMCLSPFSKPLRRLPWYLPLPWRIDKVACTDGDRHFDDEFLFESVWFGRYCFVVAGDEQRAVDLLDSMAGFLELRRATRASARHTVNVVWDLETDVPDATLDRLLLLCRETNFRLIVARTTPPDAALAGRFQETYA